MDASYQITRFDDHRGGVQLHMRLHKGSIEGMGGTGRCGAQLTGKHGYRGCGWRGGIKWEVPPGLFSVGGQLGRLLPAVFVNASYY